MHSCTQQRQGIRAAEAKHRHSRGTGRGTGRAQARLSLSSFILRTKLKGSVVISVPKDRAYMYIAPFP